MVTVTKSFSATIDSIPLPVNPIPVAPAVNLAPVGPNIPSELTEGMNVNPVPPVLTLTRYPEAPT